MTLLEVSRVAFPVTTLGHGRRIVIWMQGCSIRCPGCITAATWVGDPERAISTTSLVDGMQDWWALADGLTISGGEPLDQADEVRELIVRVRQLMSGDILLYSGHTFSTIVERWPWVLTSVDALISEPFVSSLRPGAPLRGSTNQRLHRLTKLAETRYPPALDEAVAPLEPARLDLFRDDSTWHVAGVPTRDLLAPLRRQLRDSGYELSGDMQ